MSKNILKEKSFQFAVRIINLSRFLVDKKEFIISKQIGKSGTSIGANVEEAHGAISDADFSSKISIAYKEARESLYWLRLLAETKYISEEEFNSLFQDCEELCKMLFSILKKMRIKK